jgi:hypothetical protein
MKKRLCRKYGLGSDIIITDEENRSYNYDIILEYLPGEIWLCIQNHGILMKASLKKIEYEIVKGSDCYHNFYAMVCSAWNRAVLLNYINMLVGERNRNFELYIDGNLYETEETAINNVTMRIKALARKRNLKNKCYNLVASRVDLEIWSLNIRSDYYNKYLTVWSRVTLNYAFDIWNDFTKKFPKFDWILYNNKRLSKGDLNEDANSYKLNGSMYLRGSIKGGNPVNDYGYGIESTDFEMVKTCWPILAKRNPILLNEALMPWVKFGETNKFWDRGSLRNEVVDFERIAEPWETLRPIFFIGDRTTVRRLWKCIERCEWVACLLVENKVYIIGERALTIQIMFNIEDKIIKLYPEEIEARRQRAIDSCKKDGDLIDGFTTEGTQIKLVVLANLIDIIVMHRVKVLTLQVSNLVEKKIYELYPFDMEVELVKLIAICKAEDDVWDKKEERETMKAVLDMDRWRWQIKRIWKEAKKRNLIKKKRYFKKEPLFEQVVRNCIKHYRKKTEWYSDYDKILETVSKENENYRIDGDKLIFKEYEEYYSTRYRLRHLGYHDYNKAEMFDIIRREIYPIKPKKGAVLNPYLQRIMSLRVKKGYWMVVEKVGQMMEEKCGKIWSKLKNGILRKPLIKAKKKKAVVEKSKALFGGVMKNLTETFNDKVVIPAKKLAEKEKKARSKNIRRKFRRFVDARISMEKEQSLKKPLRKMI